MNEIHNRSVLITKVRQCAVTTMERCDKTKVRRHNRAASFKHFMISSEEEHIDVYVFPYSLSFPTLEIETFLRCPYIQHDHIPLSYIKINSIGINYNQL